MTEDTGDYNPTHIPIISSHHMLAAMDEIANTGGSIPMEYITIAEYIRREEKFEARQAFTAAFETTYKEGLDSLAKTLKVYEPTVYDCSGDYSLEAMKPIIDSLTRDGIMAPGKAYMKDYLSEFTALGEDVLQAIYTKRRKHMKKFRALGKQRRKK